MQPNDQLQTLYDNAKSILVDKDGNPTQAYKNYLVYQKQWQDKNDAYQNAMMQARASPLSYQNWPIEGTKYSGDIEMAMNNWVALGSKNEIESALNLLKQSGKMPATISQ